MMSNRVRISIVKHDDNTPFRFGYFIVGLLLGPAGMLIASRDSSPSGSLKSSIVGWLVGWGLLIIGGGSLMIFIRNKAIEAQVAYDLEMARQMAAQEEETRKCRLEQEKKVAEQEKKKQDAKEFNAKLKQIRGTQQRINAILHGEEYNGFGRDEIRPFLLPGTLIKDEDVTEQVVCIDISYTNTVAEIAEANNRADIILERVMKRESLLERIYLQFKTLKDKEEAEKEIKELESRKETCTKCYGNKIVPCSKCNGEGLEIEKETILCKRCTGVGRISVRVTCNYCQGTGNVRPKCYSCNGKGRLKVQPGGAQLYRFERCGSCNGRGLGDSEFCSRCSGERRVEKWQTCNNCWGHGKVARGKKVVCSNCDGGKHFKCERCGGKGFTYRPKQ